MYQKILVALDRSSISEKVFDTALYLSKALNAQLNLINVLSSEVPAQTVSLTPFSSNYGIQILQEVRQESERRRQESLETLQYLSKKAKNEKVDTIYTQVYGEAGKAITIVVLEFI